MGTTPQDDTEYSVELGNLGAELRIASTDTDSGVAVVEHTLAPGKLGAPLHRHTREDEISYVLDGELSVQQGDDISSVGAGEFVVKGRDEWHTFWNAGSEPVRFLEIIAPGDMASYFPDVAGLMGDEMPDEATIGRILEIAGAYGIEMRPESIPELCERHDLSL